MNPFKHVYFPKYPKYSRANCILTVVLGAICATTVLLGMPRWISLSILFMELISCAIGVYRIKSYYRSMQ